MILLIGRIMQTAVTMATMKIMTTLLSPSEAGKFSLLIAIATLFSLIFINPIWMYIFRKLHEWKVNGSLKHYLNQHLIIYVLVVSLLSAGFITIYGKIFGFNISVTVSQITFIVCGYMIFCNLNQILTSVFNMLDLKMFFVIFTVLIALLSVVTSVLVVKYFGKSATNWLYGHIISQSIMFIVIVTLLNVKIETQSKIYLHSTMDNFRKVFNFSFPLACGVSLFWIQTQAYRFFLSSAGNLVEVGLFTAGYGVAAALINNFETLFTQYFQPRLYKNVSGKDLETQNAVFAEYIGLLIPSLIMVCCFSFIVAPLVTKILLGVKFQDASKYVMWGILAEALRVISGGYGLAAHIRMNTKALIPSQIIGAFMALSLSIFIIPMLKSVGAGIVLAVAGTASLAVLVNNASKLMPGYFASLKVNITSRTILCVLTFISIMTVASFFIPIQASNFTAMSLTFFYGLILVVFQVILLKHKFTEVV